MKKLVVAAAMLVCACSPGTLAVVHPGGTGAEPTLPPVALPAADDAGNRMEVLTLNGGRFCTSDAAWCVSATAGSPASVTHGDQTVALPGEGNPWGNIVRVGAGSALIGIVTNDIQTYSGGGGNAAHLKLYEVSGNTAREVATLPLGAALDIRACFSEEDQRNRADACSDQYTFVTRIGLDESVSRGAPRITLETSAGTFPGHVSRGADSTEASPLQAADLVWWHDDTCSYHRTFNRGADGLYAPDQPLPACSDYLEP